jgi:thiol-disulfide isomerase/thioredoxin
MLVFPRMHPTLIAVLLAISTCVTASAQDFPDDHFYSGSDRNQGLKSLEGNPAPELSLDTWIGEETSLADLKGKVVIVDFWATWCGPCMRAIPKNVSLVEEYGDSGLAFIGVHDANNGWDKAQGVVDDKNINYPVARDAGGASVKAYKLAFWPTYVAIDRQGIVRAAGLLPDKVADVVRVLLAEGGGATGNTATTGEFPQDWYVGGSSRLPAMARLEGEQAPSLQATKWIGEAIQPEMLEGRVTVLRFMSPLSRRTRESMAAWRKTASELGPQGVIFIGVCDHLADWERMRMLLGDEEPPFPIARDAEPTDSRLPLGATATAYGVRMWPTTVVIDRSGRVRAAGIDEAQLQPVLEKLMAEPINPDN